MSSQAKGIGPEVCIDGLRPSVGGMEEHGACMFSKVSDAPFSNSILVMGTNSTKGDSLACVMDIVHESTFCKTSIVSMIMLDDYSHGGSISFKGLLGLYGFISSSASGDMDKGEPREVVSKDGGCFVSVMGQPAFDLGNETRGGRD